MQMTCRALGIGIDTQGRDGFTRPQYVLLATSDFLVFNQFRHMILAHMETGIPVYGWDGTVRYQFCIIECR